MRAALPAAGNIERLKQEAKTHGVPCLYVNDNFAWQSDFKHLVTRCIQDNVRGAQISRELVPQPDDYFVLKPRHSGFFQTPLDLLLRHLHATKLILADLRPIPVSCSRPTTDICAVMKSSLPKIAVPP